MILVTGATGLAGSAILDEFVRRREPLRVLVRNRAKLRALQACDTVEVFEGDMSNPETLDGALTGIERVLMISGPTSDMVAVQRAFIDAAAGAGIAHLIKLSGLDSRADATFRFLRMHFEAERHLEASGMRWTHLRPSGFMQVYLREAPRILTEGALYHALGETPLNPVDLADVAKVAFALLRDGGHDGETLNITGPEALTMSEMARRIAEVTDRPVRYVDVTPAERREALLARGVPPSFADTLDEQLEERLKRGAESRVDLSTHEMFGVRPTTFREFVMRNVDAFRG